MTAAISTGTSQPSATTRVTKARLAAIMETARILALSGITRFHDAGPGQPPVHGDAEFFEQAGDDAGRALLLEGGLGIGVQIPPPGGHVVVEPGNVLDNRHGAVS